MARTETEPLEESEVEAGLALEERVLLAVAEATKPLTTAQVFHLFPGVRPMEVLEALEELERLEAVRKYGLPGYRKWVLACSSREDWRG